MGTTLVGRTIESEPSQLMSWEAKTYKGQEATLRIVDSQRGSWGHILIDAIEQSNQYKSNIHGKLHPYL